MTSPTRVDRMRRARPTPQGKTPDPSVSLHLALAWLMVKTTPMNDHGVLYNIYSATFVATVLDLLAREVFEAETDPLVVREAILLARANERRLARGQHVSQDLEQIAEEHSWMEEFKSNFVDINVGCAFVDTIEREIRNRISEEGDEPLDSPEPLERRSPLGLFFRQLLVTLRKMSFDETSVLSAQIAEWCGLSPGESHHIPVSWSMYREWVAPASLTGQGVVATPETKSNPRVASMIDHQDAVASGDYSGAIQSLLRFYDHTVPQRGGNAAHHHALLNLAQYHYATGGLEAASLALEECIRLARSQGDLACLQLCTSLSNQMQTELNAAAWPGSEALRVHPEPLPARRLVKTTSGPDELWALKAAVDLGEPLPVAFRRIYTALALSRGAPPQAEGEAPRPARSLNTPSWHAAQAGLWAMLGSTTLGEMHEELALASPELEDATRLSVLLLQAERIALRGDFEGALAVLLNISAVEGLSHAESRRWARTVWDVLERQARLQCDADALVILTGLRPAEGDTVRLGPGGPLREVFDLAAQTSREARGAVLAHKAVADALAAAQKYLAIAGPGATHLALPHVLAALQLASGLSLWPAYRTGVVLFGETLLRMEAEGMARKADAELAAVWSALVQGGDEELLARAALVRAKAHAAMALDDDGESGSTRDGDAGEGSEERGDDGSTLDTATHMSRAQTYARIALSRAERLGARAISRDAAALAAMLAELGGDADAAARYTAAWAAAERGGTAGPDLCERVRRAGDVVRLVAVRVAEGWK